MYLDALQNPQAKPAGGENGGEQLGKAQLLTSDSRKHLGSCGLSMMGGSPFDVYP